MSTITNLRKFQSALKVAALATSDDPDRPILHNVQLVHGPKLTRLQAADGFRLHFVEIEAAGESCDLLLSKDLVKSILGYKVTRKEDPQVEFTAAGAQVNGKPLPGQYDDTTSKYPDVNYLIPRSFKEWFKVNTADLLAAVRRARVFARDGSNIARLHISDQALIVEGRSEENGSAQTVLNYANRTNPSICQVIGFNCDFLIDFLKTVNSDLVKFEFNGPRKDPAMFTDLETEGKALVMPMNCGPVSVLTPADLKPESAYDCAGACITIKEPVIYPGERFFRLLDLSHTFDPAQPEPGATLGEIKTVWSYQEDPPHYGKDPKTKVTVLHIVPAGPDPEAAQPVDLPINATRHPLFAGGKHLTIGVCKQCTDPNDHALYDGLCGPCQAANAALERERRFHAIHS